MPPVLPRLRAPRTTALHPTTLHPTVLHPTVLHPTVLHPTALHPTPLDGAGAHLALVAHPASRVPVVLPSPRTGDVDPAAREGDVVPAGGIGPAWIVREATHVPGVLRLAEGRLSFLSSRGVVFDVAMAEAAAPGTDLALPWHGRGGFRITVGGERLRVQVVRPHGAVEPGECFLSQVSRATGLPTTRGDADAAASWRRLLLSALGRPRRPGVRRAARSRSASGVSSPPS